MGFSVSASAAVVFIGAVLAFGILYPATANGFERVHDATDDVSDRRLARQNTAVEVTTASYDATNDTLTVSVRNEGATALSVADTDVLVDNVYQTSFDSRAVDGDATTTLWLPGEVLTVTVSATSKPDRVTVVTEFGVTESTEVA